MMPTLPNSPLKNGLWSLALGITNFGGKTHFDFFLRLQFYCNLSPDLLHPSVR